MEVLTLDKQIAQLRKELKMSQTELGEVLGLTRDTIASYENGRLNPSIEVLKNMADVFKCDLNISFDIKKKL